METVTSLTVTCPISGFAYRLPFGVAATTDIPHPAFSLPRAALLQAVPAILTGNADAATATLTYLALLHHTKLFTFAAPATPDLLHIEGTLEAVVTFGTMIAKLTDKQRAALPRYAVSRAADNASLANILEYFADVRDGLSSSASDDAREEHRSIWDKLSLGEYATPEAKQKMVVRFLSETFKSDTRTAHIHRETPNPLRGKRTVRKQLWLDILNCDSVSIYYVDVMDIEDIENYVIDKVCPNGSPSRARVILSFIRGLKTARTLLDETADIILRTPVRETVDAIKGLEVLAPATAPVVPSPAPAPVSSAPPAIDMSGAPETKPVRPNYPTDGTYYKALIQWNAAQKNAR